jgi:hypothetical protein
MLKTLSNFSLRIELLVTFLVVATIPLLLLSGLSSSKSTSALEDAIYQKLNAVQATKKKEIINLFKVFERDIESLAKSQQVRTSIFMIDAYVENCADVYKKDNTFPLDRAQYYGVHRQSASFPVQFIKTFGYDDFLLINMEAQVALTSLGIKKNVFDLPTAEYQKLINENNETSYF